MITKKKIFACICAGLIAISLMLPLPARAANSYYVSPSGNDSNPGTQTQPWKTIQKAANTLGAGDTVMVMAGDYPQRISITKSGSSSAPIIYRAQGQVTMKGFNVGASYVTIDGFEVSSTDYVSWSYSSSAGIYVTGNGNVIQNNYIHDATMSGIDVASGSGNTVINNRLYRNEMVGVEVHGSNNLVEGNEVWGTVQCPPAVTKVEGGCVSGLDADGMRYFGSGHIFRGNYIHDIPFGGYNVNPHIDCWQTFGGASDILFEQNHCVNLQSQAQDENGTGWMIENASNITIRNNIIFTYAGVDGNLATGFQLIYL